MHRRHTPRRRGIQYAAASRFIMDVSGILDRPLSRTMTTGGLACSNASDTTPHSRDALRPRFAPTSLSKERAQGKPGARCTRSLACESDKAHEHSHHRFTGITRPSLRNGFTAYFVVSPETGLFCLRRSRKFTAKLDTSVGVSGPHDFAVRVVSLVLRHLRVHRIPLPTFVTIAKRPSW
jgi:hypothetical protein